MSVEIDALLKSGMGKKTAIETPEIYLGQWLREFSIGATEAAKIAGCSQPHISNVSGGRRPNINVLFLLRLSEHMGVTVNDFFRPLPSKSQIESLQKLSPKAQAALLSNRRKKA